MSCITSSVSIAKTTINFTILIVGFALLHVGAAMFGFVSGDFAGRWYLQHKLHLDNVEQYRRPFQVPMGRKWMLQMAVVPVTPEAPQLPMELISGDGELWMEDRSKAYAAELERIENYGAAQQEEVTTAVVTAAALSAAARASVAANALRGHFSVVKGSLVDPLLPASSGQANGRAQV